MENQNFNSGNNNGQNYRPNRFNQNNVNPAAQQVAQPAAGTAATTSCVKRVMQNPTAKKVALYTGIAAGATAVGYGIYRGVKHFFFKKNDKKLGETTKKDEFPEAK